YFHRYLKIKIHEFKNHEHAKSYRKTNHSCMIMERKICSVRHKYNLHTRGNNKSRRKSFNLCHNFFGDLETGMNLKKNQTGMGVSQMFSLVKERSKSNHLNSKMSLFPKIGFVMENSNLLLCQCNQRSEFRSEVPAFCTIKLLGHTRIEMLYMSIHRYCITDAGESSYAEPKPSRNAANLEHIDNNKDTCLEPEVNNTLSHGACGCYESTSSSRINNNATSSFGIDLDNPRYPNYAALQVRISSFQGWPSYLDQTPKQMATAGFLFAGYQDYTRCFFCGGGLRNWESGDDPWVEHARWFPICSYIRQNKGDRFVKAVQDKHEQLQSSTKYKPGIKIYNERAKHSAAVKSVCEMGYSKEQVVGPLQILKDSGQGTNKKQITAYNILQILLDDEAEKILEENRQLKEQRLCKVCLDLDASFVFLPCGHIVCCKDCAPAMRNCPICRKYIKGTTKPPKQVRFIDRYTTTVAIDSYLPHFTDRDEKQKGINSKSQSYRYTNYTINCCHGVTKRASGSMLSFPSETKRASGVLNYNPAFECNKKRSPSGVLRNIDTEFAMAERDITSRTDYIFINDVVELLRIKLKVKHTKIHAFIFGNFPQLDTGLFGGADLEKPRYQNYAALQVRISSFQGWPSYLDQTPRQMAIAGFLFAGYHDYTRCFFCGGGLRNWEAGDDPWVEHARWFPKCTYLRQNKGDAFIKAVQDKHEQMDKSDQITSLQTTETTQNGSNLLSYSNPQQSSSPSYLDTAAARSVLEMGYTQEQVLRVIQQLLPDKPGGTFTALDIMTVLLEKDENQTMVLPDQHPVILQNASGTSTNTSRISTNTSGTSTNTSGTSTNAMQSNNTDDAELLVEKSALRDQRLCKICLELEASIAFLPCGHLVCCSDCAPAMRKCPICRTYVKGTINHMRCYRQNVLSFRQYAHCLRKADILDHKRENGIKRRLKRNELSWIPSSVTLTQRFLHVIPSSVTKSIPSHASFTCNQEHSFTRNPENPSHETKNIPSSVLYCIHNSEIPSRVNLSFLHVFFFIVFSNSEIPSPTLSSLTWFYIRKKTQKINISCNKVHGKWLMSGCTQIRHSRVYVYISVSSNNAMIPKEQSNTKNVTFQEELNIIKETLDEVETLIDLRLAISTDESMSNGLLRLHSFNNFPRTVDIFVSNLSKAGFYFTGNDDNVQCYACGITYRNWKRGDIPLEIHRRLSPLCPHIRNCNSVAIDTNEQQHIPSQDARLTNIPTQSVFIPSINVQQSIGIQQNNKKDTCSEPEVNNTLSHGACGCNESSSSSRISSNATSSFGIDLDNPRYPNYAALQVRISSFQGWPSYLDQTPKQMATAGFLFAGYQDYTRCFFCGGGLRNWEAGDDPWVEHARWFPKCSYLRQNKGDRFIKAVQDKHEQLKIHMSILFNLRTKKKQSTTNNYYGINQRLLNNRRNFGNIYLIAIFAIITTSPTILISIVAFRDNFEHIKFNHHCGTYTATDIMSVLLENDQPNSSADSANAVRNDSSANDLSLNATTQGNDIPEPLINDLSESNLDDAESLIEENRQLRDQRLCKICLELDASIAFLPCGHLVSCSDCAPALRRCPMCRAFVKGTVKTFLV
ncbi:baculoviral IAP repeat-containing protein 7/8, partial [Mytilus galloprovincialis]